MRIKVTSATTPLSLMLALAFAGCTGSPSVEPDPPPDGGVPLDDDSGAPRVDGSAVDGSSASLPFTGCPGSAAAYATFDAFWNAFDTSYALFDVRLRDGSWDDVGRDGCARMSETITDDELFDVLLDMGRRLDDGHVSLFAEALDRDEDAWVSVYPHLDEAETVEEVVEEAYLDEDLSWAAEDWFAWGMIGDVGYLSITSMDELTASGDDEEEDVRAAAEAMEAVMDDLGDASAIIVDVRGNGGGWDSVALEVAAWFAGPRTVAWTKQRRAGPGRSDFGEPETTFVEETRGGGYGGPVALLTSGATFSAAETFALAMRVRDHVSIIGEPSSGHFSDMMDHELPNGWELTLSGERYSAADGVIYETRGVPVDVAVTMDAAALPEGTDNMLEAALRELGATR